MKYTKRGFTIPELMIFLTIVGVICVFMLTVIRPGERYIPYAYYGIYDALSTAVFNIKEDAIDKNNTDKDGTIKTEDKVFPGAKSDPANASERKEAARELCKKLAIDPEADPDDANSGSEYGYLNATEYMCDAENFKPLSLTAQFTTADMKEKMAFRTTNSMRLYISELGSINVTDNMNNNASQQVKYFVVWVDLNGDRAPNSKNWSRKRAVDFVPFVITTSGVVIPVGAPIVDPRYMTVRIQYPSGSTLKYSVKSMTFIEGRIAAYNDRQYPSYELFSISNNLFSKGHSTSSVLYTSSDFNNETEKYESIATVDDLCKVADGQPPQCTLVVDVNKRF